MVIFFFNISNYFLNKATIGIVFKNDQQAAFNQNRFTQGVTLLIAFGYSGFLNVRYKIYLQLITICVAFVCIVVLHVILKKESKEESKENNENYLQNS